jgi:hypothetical protein
MAPSAPALADLHGSTEADAKSEAGMGEDDQQLEEEAEVGEVAAAAGRPSAMFELGEVAEFLRPAMVSRPLCVHGGPLSSRIVCSDRL